MSTSAITSDPYASIAVPMSAQNDPYAAIAKPMQGTAPPDTRSLLQKGKDAFDRAAQTVPVDTSSVGKFASSVGNDLGAGAVRLFSPLVHPVDTAVGLAKMGAAAGGNPGAIIDVGTSLVRPFIQNPSGEAVAAIPQLALALAGGGEASTAAKAIEQGVPEGGVAGAAATAAKAAAKTAGSKILPALVDGPPESVMTRAIKPGKNNINWNRDVQTALPLMKSAEQQIGTPVTGIDDAIQAAQTAKKAVWSQYQQRLGPAAAQGATIDGNQIADAMMSSIDKRTALQNPGLVDKVQSVADTYRRPLPLNEAEDFLQSANKDLNTYYSKNKVGQKVALNDPEISSTVAEGDALRSALYSKLDDLSGPGAAQLKQAYGSLTNMEKELYGRQLVYARQAPESLSEQLSTVRGVGKIAKGLATFSPGDVLEGTQNIAVARVLKARNSSDAMITRAFQNAQPAQPFPMPSSPRIAGLLPANAGAQAPSGAFVMPGQVPYSPAMSAGERSAALNQWLRQRQQMALPAQAQPIPLPPPQ